MVLLTKLKTASLTLAHRLAAGRTVFTAPFPGDLNYQIQSPPKPSHKVPIDCNKLSVMGFLEFAFPVAHCISGPLPRGRFKNNIPLPLGFPWVCSPLKAV